MPPAIWNIVIGAPLAASVALLAVVRPFLAEPMRIYVVATGIVLFAIAIGAALLRNRLTTGAWTRPISQQQRVEIRSRARASQIMTLATFGALSLVGLPLVFWLRKQGWSKDATLFITLLAGAPVLAIALFLARRSGNPPAANQPGSR